MKGIKLVVIVIVIAALAVGGYFYYQHSKLFPSTDDAFLKANIVQVAPQVSGRVSEVLVQSNQQVLKGQALLQIETTPFDFALAQAQAAYDLAAKKVGVESATVVSAQATVKRMQAALDDANAHASRIQSLLDKGLAGQEAAEHANSLASQAQAAFDTAQSELNKAIQALGASSDGDNTQNAEIRHAAAVLSQAQYNLDNTLIRASYSGLLGNVDVRPGNMVRAQQPLFPLIESHDYWIEANFKETDLERIKVGQNVSIELDMFPGSELKGTVQSVSPASGASFSLLPPENATGNWVKVTQRFPVRIAVSASDDAPPLRVGASASVSVDTSKHSSDQSTSQ